MHLTPPFRFLPGFALAVLLVSGCTADQHADESRPPGKADTLPSVARMNRRVLVTSLDCEQMKLSRQFDVAIHLLRFTDTASSYDSCVLRAVIRDKQTEAALDTLSFISGDLYSFCYENCDSAISFSTGYRANTEVSDNYYGDLVVADLNFDGRDDLALVRAIGGNGGPMYNYYLQGSDRQFSLDSFLTDSVAYFPTAIDKRRHRLITYVHASVRYLGEQVYQYHRKTETWRQISHRFVAY